MGTTLVGLALLPAWAYAGNPFTFSGTLATDADQQSYFFTLTAPGSVILTTNSYATGGFNPSLAVFDASGNLIASNQDGGCANVPANPTTGFCWDAYLNLSLPAGTYQAVVTESENVANGPTLSSAFAYTGQGNWTRGPESTGTGGFWDLTGVQLSPSFGISVAGANSAAPQFAISQQSPPSGQVASAYSYQFTSTGGTSPYTWSVSSGNLPTGLTLSQAGLLSGTPAAYGTFSFALQASDSSGPSMSAGPSNFQITVIPQILSINTTSLTTWVVNNAFTQTLTATGGYLPLTWTITGNPGGLSISPSGVLSGTPPATGMFTVPVTVTDAQENTAQMQYTWQVNPPITITSNALLPPGVTGRAYPGFTFTSQGGATPTDVWTVASGAIPPGTSLSMAGALSGSTTTRGAYAFTVQASDAVQPARQNATLNVYDPLTITTSALPGGTLGLSYGPASLAATGGSGGYVWSSPNAPAGLAVSSSGTISGTPSTGGTATFTVNLADTTAAQTATAQLQITVGYQQLLISSIGNLGGVALGATVSKTFSATGGKQPYTWSGSGLPAGLSITAASGALSGATAAAGNFTFTIQVTDANGTSATLSATLAVLGLTTSSGGSASTVSTYSQTFTATGGTQPYAFVGTGIPAGLTLSSTGVLSGTPRAAGTYSFTVQVTDAGGITVSGTFSLTVTAPAFLSVSGSSLSNGTVGMPYSDTLNATGGVPPYSWSITAGTLPNGLASSASGTISGNPMAAGTYSFSAQVTDASGATATGAISIAIASPPLAAPTSSLLPNGIVGSDYFTQILAPSGGTQPYSFAISTGSLPPGISLTNGQIAGTPTMSGTYPFTLSISDSSSPPSTVTQGLSILINPQATNLLISAGSLPFALTTGANGVPSGATVAVRSSVSSQILNFTAAATPAVSWLDVTGGGATPATIGIALDPSAVNLAASATPYTATVTVTCATGSQCSGMSQQITVSLTVSAPPPQLSIASSLISFSATSLNPTVPTQGLGIQNSGAGSLGIRSITAADGWVTIGSAPGSVSAGPGASVAIGVNPTGLAPGFYRSTITVSSSAGTATVPVTYYEAQNNSIQLSPVGVEFTAQAGSGPGQPGGSFVVSVAGTGTVQWNASVIAGASWLSIANSSGSSTSASPGSVSFSLSPLGVAALAPGVYYGDINVTSSNASNAPQDFEVVLNVTPAAVPAQPSPVPEGLVFISSAGAAVPAQMETIYASSTAAVAYQASVTIFNGSGWLSVSPTTGMTSSASPAQLAVSVNPGSLTPGVYAGGVNVALPSAAVRTVNVTLIVTAGTVTPQAVISSADTPRAACSPTKLVPTQTGLTGNFSQPASWPVPLSILLVDDCGNSIVNGQVVTTFSNGDPPLPLTTTDSSSGIYSGTWTPRAPSPQLTITARATASGFNAATAQIAGQVSPNAAPVLTPNGTLHVFDPLVGAALGPGNIVQIYGQNLASQTLSATNIPLPTTLGGTSVIVGGIQVPLYFVSPGQINAQIPFQLTAGTSYQVLVSANGALTTPNAIQLTVAAPGIAAFVSGEIIAQHLDGTLVSETSPAVPGEFIVFYMAGLGQTTNPVATGAASPGTNLATPLVMPTLTLGGENVPILFAGLTPGLVGLYQVNFQVPSDAANGDLQLVVSQGGMKSNSTVLPVMH
jgi:uncharacterized protein (TIGR03437 family)